MQDTPIKLSKFTGSIYRCTQSYANEHLKQFHLTSASYPYLLTLYYSGGINQNQISKELYVDKSMSAREIKKLIQLGYVTKELDQTDARAYKLYLTESGRALIPEIRHVVNGWNEAITQNLREPEKKELIRLLDMVLQESRHQRCIQRSEPCSNSLKKGDCK